MAGDREPPIGRLALEVEGVGSGCRVAPHELPSEAGRSAPTRAVLLAAGTGERLRPETDDKPKALVEVGGRPLIAHALECLGMCGVREAVVVSGHHHQRLDQFLTRWAGAVTVEVRFNPRFAAANNVVSLACAADFVAAGTWIVETDVIAEPSAWHALAAASSGDAHWLAASFGPAHDGAMLIADRSLRLRQWLLSSGVERGEPAKGVYKSMGLVTISAGCGRALAESLRKAVASGRDQLYYDQILAEHLEEYDVRVVDGGSSRWAEIDTPEDLGAARGLFGAA